MYPSRSDPPRPPPAGPPPNPQEGDRNFPKRGWPRRSRERSGFSDNTIDWTKKPPPPPPPKTAPLYKMAGPPMMGTQSAPMMAYYPMHPMTYPPPVVGDVKGRAVPNPKYPMASYMGPMMPMPGPYMPRPVLPVPKAGIGVGPVQDKYGKPVISPYYKESPIRPPAYKDPVLAPPYYQQGYVNLSQVSSLGIRQKRNLETMSEISNDHESVSSAEETVEKSTGAITGYEVKYFTPFLPRAPERYKAEYDLHELKVFLPLGVKAYLKAQGLNPKLSLGFETGPVRNGKLVLLLDLDNTLLHTASQARLDMLDIEPGDFVDGLGDPELYSFTLPNFPNVNYYMKLRPCIREFLQILSLYYEMSIYTNATKEYADVVISILDPDRSLFMDRIVARNSVDEKDLLKSASRLYPDLDPRFILAFDDRKDVWSDIPHKQVVRAEHYDFFESYMNELTNNYTPPGPKAPAPEPATAAPDKALVFTAAYQGASNDYTFNVEQESEAESDPPAKSKIVDHDKHLHYMVRVFLEIHKRFFADPFRNDAGSILEGLQSEVLKGVGVLLTGYRKNAKMTNAVLHADCEQKQKENLTEMGASLIMRLNDPKLTHIMAGKNTTDNITKSRDPQYKHVHKVHTLWLYSCRATFTKVDEALFAVDEICNRYSNEPPVLPNKDHWKFLAKESGDEADSVKAGSERKGRDEIPVRIFMGTGSYSNGTEVISSVEKILIKWDPGKTKLLQNTLPETARPVPKQFRPDLLPFTNAANPNKYAF